MLHLKEHVLLQSRTIPTDAITFDASTAMKRGVPKDSGQN